MTPENKLIFVAGMRATIIVSKSEMKNKPELVKKVEAMSVDILELADAYMFTPKAGHLYEMLNCLTLNRVNYKTHFSQEGDR